MYIRAKDMGSEYFCIIFEKDNSYALLNFLSLNLDWITLTHDIKECFPFSDTGRHKRHFIFLSIQ